MLWSSSGRCFWCLEEVQADYEAKAINFKDKEHKSEAFLKINPNGKVPALTDGDFSIWESTAINYYLADANNVVLEVTVSHNGIVGHLLLT